MFAEGTQAGRRAARLRRMDNGRAAAEALEYLRQRAPDLMADNERHLAAGWDEEGPIAALAGSWLTLLRLCALDPAFGGPVAQLDGRVALAEAQQPSMSAGTKPFPDGSFLIVLDGGLIFATFEFAQLLVAASWSTPPGGTWQDQQTRIAALAELHLAQHMMTAGATSLLGYLPDPAQGAMTGEITQAAQMFVLAHELGHMLLEHGERTSTSQWQDEHAADLLALRILALDLTDADPQAGARWIGRLLGVRLLLSCLDVVENHTYVRTGTTHPPVGKRWSMLRDFAGSMVTERLLATVDELWSSWQQCFDRAGECGLDIAVLERHFDAVAGSWLSRPPPPTRYLLDLVVARRSLLDASPLPDRDHGWASDAAARVTTVVRAGPANRALTWRAVLQAVADDVQVNGISRSVEEIFTVAATVAAHVRGA